MSNRPVVLIVDDEHDITHLYSHYLGERCKIRVANTGEEALDKLDESVDVLLLDRRLREMSGDDVLRKIREEGYTTKVAMLTVVEPDFDIIDMDFDTYLTKPVSEPELVETVEGLLRRERYEESIQEFFALSSKKATLESEKPARELRNSEEFSKLNRKIEQLREEVDDELLRIAENEGFETAFRDMSPKYA